MRPTEFTARVLFSALPATLCCGLALAPIDAAAQPAPMPSVRAADRAEVAPLAEALRIEELMAVMRAEGLAYAIELRDQLFPGEGDARWTAATREIYAMDAMTRVMVEGLVHDMSAEDVTAATRFFESDLGQRIVDLEIAAREGLMEEGVEEASHDHLDELPDADPERMKLLEAFIAANDLLEENVVGALNANLAFFEGLDAGGAYSEEWSETGSMYGDLWAQEARIRQETGEWIYSYLAMAYAPLTDSELSSYIAFSESDAGIALNTALFGAFDRLYTRISYDLGRGAARFIAGDDI
ncbi:DUF2059 domain-containing protein [Roseicyclus sp. F158]|uniref:DUF2059 domain-containing protein n=1 Tax=Tropicimonas omnivorans TaxID=3075590 RepID=A0ABU3DJY6_9RHOB|nr:DUF2059 domain-containing protein [Roseicyclus sp. F158]MDT0683849.1 DUF2059 domain-containing protein [Roseicyclus sp. F158]